MVTELLLLMLWAHPWVARHCQTQPGDWFGCLVGRTCVVAHVACACCFPCCSRMPHVACTCCLRTLLEHVPYALQSPTRLGRRISHVVELATCIRASLYPTFRHPSCAWCTCTHTIYDVMARPDNWETTAPTTAS
jgi:hypothetical protein